MKSEIDTKKKKEKTMEMCVAIPLLNEQFRQK